MADAAEAAAAVTAAVAAAVAADAVLTMPEILSKLDRIHTFTMVTVLDNGSRDACPTADGMLAFFTDPQDAKVALAELKVKYEANGVEKATLDIEIVPLGRAFAITQGLMGLKSPMPAKLVFSKAIVKVEGDHGVPPALRPRMAGVGPFPLFLSIGLDNQAIMPVFLSRDDLADAWAKRGHPLEELGPSVIVTDLRTLVGETLNKVAGWRSLVFVQPRAAMDLARAILKQGALASSLVQGGQLLEKVKERVAMEDGDAPPPLV